MNTHTIWTGKFSNSDAQSSVVDEYFCTESSKSKHRDVPDEKKTEPQHKCKGDAPPKRKKIFSVAELAAIKKQHEKGREYYPSKRPLRCPHVNCNRCVRVLDLRAHFEHEHIEVPIIQALLDRRNTLMFHPKEIRCGMKKCICLLTISPPMEEIHKNTTDTIPENQQTGATLAVLASRVAAARLDNEESGCSLQDDESNTTAVKNNDLIILWVASNVVCDNTCTVAVSTISENVRVKYRGPVLQLGNNANKVCMEGYCLILRHFHYLGMSEKGLKPLRLDVVVHAED